MALGRNIVDWAAAALALLLLSIAVPAHSQSPTAGRAITNVAEAEWRSGPVAGSTRSNEVRIPLSGSGAIIETFRPDPSGRIIFSVTPASCGGANLPLPSQNPTPSGSTASYAATSSYRVGQDLVFRLTAPGANLDSDAIDSVEIRVVSTTGDEEVLTVFETSPNSGEFAAAMPTTPMPPAPVIGDCRLSLQAGEQVTISYLGVDGATLISTSVDVTERPFGFVFDSQNGEPVNGARVTLVDTVSGLPAIVSTENGRSRWPSTVTTGRAVTDADGNVYSLAPGEFRFPVLEPGTYRIEVEPPDPYSSPSEARPEQLARFSRPGGGAYVISDASYERSFSVSSSGMEPVDIPVDRPLVNISVSKSVSRQIALPGDIVFYTLTVANPDRLGPKRNVLLSDFPSQWLRLRPDSVRINGQLQADRVKISPDGSELQVSLGEIPSGGSHRVTYAMAVRADAPEGVAVNQAVVTDENGNSARASASLRINREIIGARMVLIGQVSAGSCEESGERRGIPGVRVMLEDGSFAVTDGDGRYHFEGLLPGTHVVQVQGQTLPSGGEFVDCSKSTANAGSATSRFVRGQGGSLVVADFYAALPANWRPTEAEERYAPIADAKAAGAEIDWTMVGDGPREFLFPLPDHNPRAPAVRVAIRHKISEGVTLKANGRAVDPLTFDGVSKGKDGAYAVSVWRGIPLAQATTVLSAAIKGPDGEITETLERQVHFAEAPANVQIVPNRSHLIADGETRPVIAVRITDRKGRPVRSGVSGSVSINSPYESAEALDAMQLRQLTGRGVANPTWTVAGDDGVAFIELAPTMVSGELQLEFNFRDGEIERRHEITSWIVPGEQEWTIVGLVEGSVGARTVADNMERTGRFDSHLGEEARVAFYAKGRVLGKYLLTAAYDSAKQEEEQRLKGAIDPQAYYTVFADGSVRRFDAASREKLYVRVETAAFYALYGDFRTGFDQTDLARYDRAATGLKAEGRLGDFRVKGFAAETKSRYRRDEIQGSGLSGPYALSSRFMIPNSESIAIEVRDRFRSEVIIERRELRRFIDYDIDLLSGTIRLREPLLSRDFNLNPQFLLVEYEIDHFSGTGEWNAGVRGDVVVGHGDLRLGATALSDKGDDHRTDMVAVDVVAKLGTDTELRGEAATSVQDGVVSAAWQFEAQHHSGNLDVVAFARTIEQGFGVGQQNSAEQGRSKFGIDARYSVSENAALTASAWHDDSLLDESRRNAVQIEGELRNGDTDLRLGLAHFDDVYRDGRAGASTVIEGGARQRLLDNRLEVSASTSIALEATNSIDLPTRHRFGARYSLTNDVRLTGAYEVAEGEKLDARTLKAGVEVSPWDGSVATAVLGNQTISEYGARSYAAFGLAQSVPVTSNLMLDATIDINRQLGKVDTPAVINPEHPAASGGHLGQEGQLFEDFAAVTLGANWRKDQWVANARGEYRDGELADRNGVVLGLIRQLGAGSMLGSGFTWTRAEAHGGPSTEIFDGGIAAAHRPDNSNFALLAKLEYRSDIVRGGVLNGEGPAGRTALTVDGDASSRRLVGSLSSNWSLNNIDANEGELSSGGELGIFVGGRYSFDAIEADEVAGFALLLGADVRLGVSDRLELGARVTVRSNLTDHYAHFSAGPEIGFVPSDDVLLTLGYNVVGFRDEDFGSTRNTEGGAYVAIRMKFDADSFSSLGLGR